MATTQRDIIIRGGVNLEDALASLLHYLDNSGQAGQLKAGKQGAGSSVIYYDGTVLIYKTPTAYIVRANGTTESEAA